MRKGVKMLMKRITGSGISWELPGDFKSIWNMAVRLKQIEDILGEDYDLDRLKELVEADREGRCVVLPCKVGDTLYYIGGTYKTLIKPATVEEVYIGDGVFAVGVSSGFTTFTLQEKEWYKSKKEAESALERMEGEEK